MGAIHHVSKQINLEYTYDIPICSLINHFQMNGTFFSTVRFEDGVESAGVGDER